MLILSPSRLITIAVILILSIPAAVIADDPASSSQNFFGRWRWLGGVTPEKEIHPLPNETYTLSFKEEGRFSMKLETNVANGSYEVKERLLKINQPLVMTMAAWLPNSPAPEVVSLIENASNFFFKDGLLYIEAIADGGTLRFEKMD